MRCDETRADDVSAISRERRWWESTWGTGVKAQVPRAGVTKLGDRDVTTCYDCDHRVLVVTRDNFADAKVLRLHLTRSLAPISTHFRFFFGSTKAECLKREEAGRVGTHSRVW